ncbi:MAG: aldose 1-epimerase, partial [Pseudonocardiales bacterium]|nr:aldose 1-epimerase [Pseudonocardiales bacterium]
WPGVGKWCVKIAPSGEQFSIADGPHRATVVEVGGGVREYTHRFRHVLDGYAEDEMCSGGRGTPLMPWPNRLADGAYTFGGASYQVPLSEPGRHNAIHGLLRWRNWTRRAGDEASVVLGTVLHAQPGYPFPLDVEIEYSLLDADADAAGSGRRPGLTVTTTATNLGDRPCPFASGQHPYLAPGVPTVDGATLHLVAERWVPTDERGLPAGVEPVAGSALDFSTPRPIGDTAIDHAFTGLARDADGLAWVELSSTDGWRTRLWADRHYPYIQLFTGDTLGPDRRRRGLAVEPMTGAPNTFRSGDGLVVLGPGESLRTAWGIQPG